MINFQPVVDAMESTGKTYFRLDLYLGVEGASPFIYGIQSPNEVLKGIPFWVEFTANQGDDATALAAKVVKLIKKNNNKNNESTSRRKLDKAYWFKQKWLLGNNRDSV